MSVPARAAAARSTPLPAPTRTSPHLQAITTQAHARFAGDDLFKRAATASQLITCGYLDGNVALPRSAQPGFDCRVDTADGIWGFCPTTVIAATDCGLAAACRDSGTCTSICKYNNAPGLLTITCPSSGTHVAYCSTAILTFGVENFFLSYGYIACGASPKTENYIVTPTFTSSVQATPVASTTSTSKSTSIATSPSTLPSSVLTSSDTPELAKTDTSTTTAATAAPAGSQSPGTVVTTNQTNNQQQVGGSSDVGPIVGGVLGGLALLCGSAIAVVFIMRRNRSSPGSGTSSSAGFGSGSNPKEGPSPVFASAMPFQPAPPYAPHYNSATPPPRPPPPPQTQLYPQVYYEADSALEKYKASFDHSSHSGYPSHAVELPQSNHF